MTYEQIRTTGSCVGIGCIVLLLAGCETGEEQTPPPLGTGSLEPVRTLELEEADSAFVGQIFSHATAEFGPSGQLLIGDRLTARVLLFEPDGSLARVAGRMGEGPGEYRYIVGVGWETDERLWVIDANRITVLDEGFRVVETRRSQGYPRPENVQFSTDRAYMGWYPLFNEGDAIGIRSRSGGEAVGSLLPFTPVAREPYVQSVYKPVFRVVGDTIIGGSTVTYPHRIMNLDGEILAEFGTAPPSVGEMRVPEYGEFASDMMAGDRWQRSFGTTSSIWVAHDSLIVVEHRRAHPEQGGFPVATYRADIYDRWSLDKRVEDMDLSGPIMDWHDGLLWLLTDTPPGQWTFTGFELRVE